MKCFVPACGRQQKLNPNTKFVTVPYSKIRSKWFSAVGKNTENMNMKSTYHCCENCTHKIELVLKKDNDSWCIEDTKISNYTQTDVIPLVSTACQTVNANPISNTPVCGRSSPESTHSSGRWSPTSSVETTSERLSNLEEFIPSTSNDSDDSDAACMLPATLSIMKKRPRHYMGINKSSLHMIGLLMRKTNLSEVKIMLTFRKIKLNEDFQTLADLFDIGRSTAGSYFNESVAPIARFMKKFVKYVKPKSIARNMPLSFRRNYKQIGFILDCFETHIEKPSFPKKQAKSFSPYKSCNTVKHLICVTPDGLTCYISKAFGGRSSDLAITTACKLQKVLSKKYSVMADRGFKGIETVLLQRGVKLYRPPSASSAGLAIWAFGEFPKGLLPESGEDPNGLLRSSYIHLFNRLGLFHLRERTQ